MPLRVVDTRAQTDFSSLHRHGPPWDSVAGHKRLASVRRIISEVRQDGDEAVRGYVEKFDGVVASTLRVPPARVSELASRVDSSTRKALSEALDAIRKYHEQEPLGEIAFEERGLRAGREFRPIERVGIYVPGGLGSYPSTVLMTSTLANVAGVEEVVICTPASRDLASENGVPREANAPFEIAPEVCAAIEISGVDEVYAVGGAVAIAAMAYGTESIRPVNKIFGPGNSWVTIAKKEVFGDVGIDGLYGPSESIVLCDDTANPDLVAAELLTQAEHDPEAVSVLVCTHEETLTACLDALWKRLEGLARKEQVSKALTSFGRAVLVNDITQALEVVNYLAPEHLCLHVAEPRLTLRDVRAAGCVLIGQQTPSTISDYSAGPSHVLPTAGSARWSSGLSVRDFMVAVNYVETDFAAVARLGETAMKMAEIEGLDAHRQNVVARLDESSTK